MSIVLSNYACFVHSAGAAGFLSDTITYVSVDPSLFFTVIVHPFVLSLISMESIVSGVTINDPSLFIGIAVGSVIFSFDHSSCFGDLVQVTLTHSGGVIFLPLLLSRFSVFTQYVSRIFNCASSFTLSKFAFALSLLNFFVIISKNAIIGANNFWSPGESEALKSVRFFFNASKSNFFPSCSLGGVISLGFTAALSLVTPGGNTLFNSALAASSAFF